MPVSQGAAANYSGQWLEDKVEAFFVALGYLVITYQEWKSKNWSGEEKLLVKQPHYKSRERKAVEKRGTASPKYRPSKADFLVIRPNKKLVMIECKNQNKRGSVDKKMADVFRTAKDWAKDGMESILILEGNGFKEGTKEALEDDAIEFNIHSENKINVLGLEPFIEHVSNNNY